MIEYVEIRDAHLNIIGIIDVFNSVIWHSVFFGVGDFDIYAPATRATIELLQAERFVTRPDNEEIGIIENVNITNTEQDGRMIIASGRFAKSLLDRRHIYQLSGSANNVTILRGNVETNVRALVQNNAINCPFDSKRNIPILQLGALANIPLQIIDENGNAAEKQVSFDNLLTYTDGVLEEYGLGARCTLNGGKINYKIFTGADRSAGNTGGNMPVVFSREYDNLTESNYLYNTAESKNAALIGGTGEGVERYYSFIGAHYTGLQRRETFVDASGISKTYKDESDVEQTYSDSEYKTMIDAKGKQDIAPLAVTETFNGVIDVTNGNYMYGRDFKLGDIVTIQDKEIDKFINVRIREATEAQDKSGYTVEINYQ